MKVTVGSSWYLLNKKLTLVICAGISSVFEGYKTSISGSNMLTNKLCVLWDKGENDESYCNGNVLWLGYLLVAVGFHMFEPCNCISIVDLQLFATINKGILRACFMTKTRCGSYFMGFSAQNPPSY